MTGSQVVKKQNTTNPSGHASRRRSALRFTSGLVALLFCALGFSVWASAQRWFVYHIATPQLEMYGYSHRAYGLNCDILIAGDSTALADFVPAVIEEKTKLKTCDIAEVRANEDFVGTHFAIDDYLAHNRPPRFLVTAWTPGDLNLEHPPLISGFADAFAYGMQVRSRPWMLKAMLLRPMDSPQFIVWAGGSLARDTLQRLIHHRSAQSQIDERARRDDALGYYYVRIPPQTACASDHDVYKSSTHAQNAASIAEFRRHYSTAQTQVLFYVTPVANCDPHRDEYRSVSRDLGERPLQLLPISYFNQTDIHLTPEMAKLYSAGIAEEILQRIRSIPSATSAKGRPQ